MKIKKLLAVLLAGVLTLSMVACGGSSAPAAAAPAGDAGAAAPAENAPAAPQITLIAAHVNNEESSYHYGLTVFKEKLEELSGGAMTLEIHANGELGGDETELIEKVATQTVDVIVVSPGDLSNAVPEVDFLALPFLYTSVDHWKAAITSDKVGGFFLDKIDEYGTFHPLGYYMCGIRSVFCTTPINSLADMAGKRIRVKSSENVVKIWSALGGAPTAMAYNEIYSGLQNNVIDAAENDIANILNMNFFEPAPYVSLTQHDYATRFIVIGSARYKALTPEQQAWVDEAGMYSTEKQWEYDMAYADTCRKTMEDQGTEFITVDTSEWVAVCEPILTEIANKLGVADAYQGIIDLK